MVNPLRSLICPFLIGLGLATPALAQKPKAEEEPVVPFDPASVEPEKVPLALFHAPEGLEVTLWASSPQLFNPTNIDIDKDGRIWVAEGVRYRKHFDRQPEGDRIMVLEDTDGDGKADSSHVFVQEEALVAPLGVAVIGNKIVVSQPPELIIYTDTDGDLKFDSGVDKREVLLTGFNGKNHDHSLHSVTAGPEGKWYFNAGNTGAVFTDRDGKEWVSVGPYRPKLIGPYESPFDADAMAGKPSSDGHVYVGGFTARINPDGTGTEIIGHNYRNSFEQSVNSLGDVFQNDNDDPPACRVSWVMTYANFGFASNDGQRSWRADQRPGQPTAVAEWRQEDPGIAPAGDVYGGGSPTGNVFYENGALGDKWTGTFLACEAGRNVVFSYQPQPDGAGFRLEGENFVTSNPEGKFAGSDFLGGTDSVNLDTPTLFRPSDVAVGPDGAIYISDWYDGRVGGHQDLDETCSGAIYRVAPKGFTPKIPEFDLATTEGQITALMSPAVNVRNLGFVALKEQGDAVLPALEAKVLSDPNEYIAARAIWLMAQLGPEGKAKVKGLLKEGKEWQRIVAYRAIRALHDDFLPLAREAVKDDSPAVRREVALSMRDVPFAGNEEIFVTLAKGYDGLDRSYLEAFGTGATGKESEVYDAVKAALQQDEPANWFPSFARIAWRLHPPQALEALAARAKNGKLPVEERHLAMDALAFIPMKEAADVMMDLAAEPESPLRADALWWLLNRDTNEWKEFGLMPQLAQRGIFDPGKVEIMEVVSPDPSLVPDNLPPAEEVLKLEGDPNRGKLAAQRCLMCHNIEGVGVEFGPTLTGWGRTQTREVIATSILNPSADIAHGYDGAEIKTKDGKTIHGLLIKDSNPFIITSMGGVTQIVPGGKIQSRKKMDRSLMMSAAQLGMTAQDVADVVAYLKSI